MRCARFVFRHGFDLVVIAVAATVQIEIWALDVSGPKAVVIPGMLLATLPLLLRRRFPLAAGACVFGALGAMTLADPVSTAGSPTLAFAVFFAFWSVGAHAELPQAVAGLALGFAAIVVVTERDPGVEYSETGAFFLVGAGIWLAALALGRRGRRTSALQARTARLEHERGERERAAVAAERRRIARELHDVIAHSVGVMIVQAGAARMLLAEQAARAADPLKAVEEAGRQALTELRRLLGVLGADATPATRTPQPGLAQVGSLAAREREAGLPVELIVEGRRRSLAQGLELAAYRIVQEALTNARKHADAAPTRVVVRYGRDALELSITDDGSARGTGDRLAGGHGLVGMRERVAVYGGELAAGPLPEGGFGVRARLPLERTRPHDRRSPVVPAPTEAGERAPSLPRLRPGRWLDALVILTAVATELELALASVQGPLLVLVPGALLWTLPLLLRDRFPFAAPVFCFVALMLSTFAGDEVGGVLTSYAALLLAFWAVGAGNSRPQALAGVAIGFATIAVGTARDTRVDPEDGLNAAAVGVVVALVAYAVRSRERQAAELEEQAVRLERGREERERAVVDEERTRIARELHDVIAHCVSLMTVQAGAARLLLHDDPRRAVEPLLQVEETGRQALAEMRRLLEILRRETAEPALAPRPGVGELLGLESAGRILRGQAKPAGPPRAATP